MNLRKTFALIGALAVGGVTIPLLANVIPTVVYALFGVFTGSWGHSVYFSGGGSTTPVQEN